MKTATVRNLHSDAPPTRVSRPNVKRPQTAPSVVQQVRAAFKPNARLATLLGALLGGFVPLATYTVSHFEITTVPLYAQLCTYIVLGGLLYSAKTVYEWGRHAFQNPAKAVGFVVLLEGIMVVSHTPWLALSALAYLVGINGIATGCNLSRT